jgi:uncharacterized protein (UPF0218 family)/phosphopantetheine adenylyltransferase
MSMTYALNLFDRLHEGHSILIDVLIDMANPIAAIIDGELLGDNLELASIIQPLEIREKNLRKYLSSLSLDSRVEVITLSRIDDLLSIREEVTFLMFEGPCCMEIEETLLTMRKHKLGFDDRIELLKPVKAKDNDKLSSARIRKGEIDRKGRPLCGTREPPRMLEVTDRADLKSPKGDVYHTKDGPPERRVVKRIQDENPNIVIAVGDVTCATVLDEGYTPEVCVVDGITKRGVYERKFKGDIEYLIYNPPATLYPETWSAIDTAIHDGLHSLVCVEGEEDLMGFPAVLLAPEKSVLIYGQPNVGIIWVPINQTNKKLARDLLNKMPIIS